MLNRNIFTHIGQVAKVRQFAAKLLSGKDIDRPRKHIRLGLRITNNRHIVAKPTEFS